MINSSSESLNQIYWTQDGKYLIFTTLDITTANETLYDDEPQTSHFFVYAIDDNKVIFQKDGGGIKNFLLRGNLIFFDDGFGDKSNISTYNLLTNEYRTVIEIKGGCGLNYIPFIPDYDA